MLALYRAGRQADALEVYQRARRALMQELGLEPGPRLQELEREILNHDPKLDATSRRSREPVSRVIRSKRLAAWVLAGTALVAGGVAGIVFAHDHHGRPLVAQPNSLAVVDPGRNRLVAVVPVGTTPRGVAVGSSVWVANASDGTVSQLNSRTLKVVQTVGIGAQATDIALGAGDMWVVTGVDNTLVHMDPRTGAVLATLRLPKEDVEPATAPAIAVGGGAVWAASGTRLLKIDPATGLIVIAGLGSSPSPGQGCCHSPLDVAVGAGSVWIVDLAELLVRISPATAKPSGQPVQIPYPGALAVGYGSVWVAGADYSGGHPAVWGIDPQTLQVKQTVALGPARPGPGVTFGLATGEGAVWLTDYDKGTLLRIDPATGAIVATIHIGAHPRGVAVGAHRVWVTVD